ncbi:MAG TPA: hypothetical protein VLB09_02595, partial [Nitrospiria bacterium]|nr:hypothetical protein [Nitrospiria bacterium]
PITFPGKGAFPGKGHNPFQIPTPEPPPVVDPAFPNPGGAFHYPIQISLTDGGWLLVSDSRRKAVLRVDPWTLLPDQSLPISGTPLAAAMLGTDVFVGVMEIEAIQRFDHRGIHQGYLAAPGTIGHPCDLATDRMAGLIFALDCLSGEVRVYNTSDGPFYDVIAAGELMSPTGIAIDTENLELFISDYGNVLQPASVKVFSYRQEKFGALVATISGGGECGWFGCIGGFSRPRGPAVRNGVVYFPDCIYHQVLMYDRTTLAMVGALGTGDPAIGDLRIPTDMAIGPFGDVYVTSIYSNSVVVFWGGAP